MWSLKSEGVSRVGLFFHQNMRKAKVTNYFIKKIFGEDLKKGKKRILLYHRMSTIRKK
jgi:hypothetical protein